MAKPGKAANCAAETLLCSRVREPFDYACLELGKRWAAAATQFVHKGHSTYSDYLRSCLVSRGIEDTELKSDLDVLGRDIIARTNIESFREPSFLAFFRKCPLPQQELLARLERVLVAFIRRNRRTGYLQGMNFVAVVLLCLMSEEDAFWCLCWMVELRTPDFYSRFPCSMQGFRVLSRIFTSLATKALEKTSSALGPELFEAMLLPLLPKFFFSFFVDVLPLECTLFVLDRYFVRDAALPLLHIEEIASNTIPSLFADADSERPLPFAAESAHFASTYRPTVFTSPSGEHLPTRALIPSSTVLHADSTAILASHATLPPEVEQAQLEQQKQDEKQHQQQQQQQQLQKQQQEQPKKSEDEHQLSVQTLASPSSHAAAAPAKSISILMSPVSSLFSRSNSFELRSPVSASGDAKDPGWSSGAAAASADSKAATAQSEPSAGSALAPLSLPNSPSSLSASTSSLSPIVQHAPLTTVANHAMPHTDHFDTPLLQAGLVLLESAFAALGPEALKAAEFTAGDLQASMHQAASLSNLARAFEQNKMRPRGEALERLATKARQEIMKEWSKDAVASMHHDFPLFTDKQLAEMRRLFISATKKDGDSSGAEGGAETPTAAAEAKRLRFKTMPAPHAKHGAKSPAHIGTLRSPHGHAAAADTESQDLATGSITKHELIDILRRSQSVDAKADASAAGGSRDRTLVDVLPASLVSHLFDLYDVDHSGSLDFREFLCCMSLLHNGSPEDRLKLCFDVFDCDGDGFLDREEAAVMAQCVLRFGQPDAKGDVNAKPKAAAAAAASKESEQKEIAKFVDMLFHADDTASTEGKDSKDAKSSSGERAEPSDPDHLSFSEFQQRLRFGPLALMRAFSLTHLVMGRRTECCWELQRFWPLIGWSSKLLPLDPPSWTDDRLHTLVNKETFSLPDGWKWETEWQLVINRPPAETPSSAGGDDWVLVDDEAPRSPLKPLERQSSQPAAGGTAAASAGAAARRGSTSQPSAGAPAGASARRGSTTSTSSAGSNPKSPASHGSNASKPSSPASAKPIVAAPLLTDADGWSYATHFSAFAHWHAASNAARALVVRRRKWVRSRCSVTDAFAEEADEASAAKRRQDHEERLLEENTTSGVLDSLFLAGH